MAPSNLFRIKFWKFLSAADCIEGSCSSNIGYIFHKFLAFNFPFFSISNHTFLYLDKYFSIVTTTDWMPLKFLEWSTPGQQCKVHSPSSHLFVLHFPDLIVLQIETINKFIPISNTYFASQMLVKLFFRIIIIDILYNLN